jgi:hypothetical protein
MNYMKSGVILLALLLAGLAMVPLVSAAEISAVTLNDNTTTTKYGEIIESKAMGSDFAIKNGYITRKEFADLNADYFNLVRQKSGLKQSEIDKLIDREYAKGSNNLSPLTTSSVIQIENKDIYMWPWSNTLPDTSSSSGSVNLIFYGKTHGQMDTYMRNNALNLFQTGIGLGEFGYRGSSSGSMGWTFTGAAAQLEYGSYYASRYHLVLLDGLYSATLNKDWTYGNCHHEYWSDSGYTHYLYANGEDQGRAFVDSSITSSITRNYLNLNNYDSGWADGYGLRYIMA